MRRRKKPYVCARKGPPPCQMAQFSLNNVHKRGLKHHFISFPPCQRMRPEIGGGKGPPPCQRMRPEIGEGRDIHPVKGGGLR